MSACCEPPWPCAANPVGAKSVLYWAVLCQKLRCRCTDRELQVPRKHQYSLLEPKAWGASSSLFAVKYWLAGSAHLCEVMNLPTAGSQQARKCFVIALLKRITEPSSVLSSSLLCGAEQAGGTMAGKKCHWWLLTAFQRKDENVSVLQSSPNCTWLTLLCERIQGERRECPLALTTFTFWQYSCYCWIRNCCTGEVPHVCIRGYSFAVSCSFFSHFSSSLCEGGFMQWSLSASIFMLQTRLIVSV